MEKRKIRVILPVVGLIFIMLAAGCGASKTYVDQTVSEERARSEASVSQMAKDVAANTAELGKLQSLTAQLEKKTDMAINQAKGFEDYQVMATYEIYFDFNSSKITMDAQSILDQAGDKMTTDRKAVMEIAGYCDPTGSAAYNMDLGNKRSAAAKYYLVDNFGVNLYRIFSVSYGKNKAVEMGDGKPAYAKDRKVVIKIWGPPQ
jgi:peptidoglycan-associated lipoprotein